MEGFLRYEFGGLIFGGAYTWRGLFSEFYGILGLKHTLPTPRYGQYLTHAHNHITEAVAAMDSCFALIGAQHHGSRWVKNPLLQRRVQIRNPSLHGRH